jgi:hypothetical protein
VRGVPKIQVVKGVDFAGCGQSWTLPADVVRLVIVEPSHGSPVEAGGVWTLPTSATGPTATWGGKAWTLATRADLVTRRLEASPSQPLPLACEPADWKA